MLRTLFLFLLGIAALAQNTPWGLDSISYKRKTSGAQASTQRELNERVVNVFDWLTKAQREDVTSGAGTLDLRAAIQTAMNEAPIGCTMYFPLGGYKISGSTAITRTGDISINCEPGSKFVTPDSTSQYIFTFQGSIGSFYNNASAITANARTFTAHATLAASLQAGDMLMFSSDTSKGGSGVKWYGGRAYYYKGELQTVVAIDGQTVTVRSPFRDAYDAGVAGVARIVPAKVNIKNMSIEGRDYADADQTAIQLKYVRDSKIEGGTITGFSKNAVSPWWSQNVVFDNVTAYNQTNDPGVGIGIMSCQQIFVKNCHLTGYHAGIDAGAYEPCRDIFIANTYLDSVAAYGALTCHGNVENLVADGCIINNGTALGGKNIRVLNSDIFVRSKPVQYFTDWEGPHTEEGYSSGCTISFINNRITAVNEATTALVFEIAIAGTVDLVELRGNSIRSGTGTSANWFDIRTVSGSAVTGVISRFVAEGNTAIGTNTSQRGIVFDTTITATNVHINHNRFTLPIGIHVYWLGANATSKFIEICDNYFLSTDLNASSIKTSTSQAERIIYNRNIYEDPNLNYYASNFTASQYLELIGNTWKGMKHHAVDVICPNTLYKDNTKILVSENDSLLGGRVYHAVTPTGNVIATYAALPISGVWTVGDRIENSAATAGNPKAWRITTAGGFSSSTRADATAYAANTWIAWSTGTTIWECTTAGTTTTGAPSISGKVVGDTVTDGTAVFTMRSTTTAAATSEGNL